MFRLPTDLSAHLQGGQTLLVPTRQRVRAVQLAYAAAQLAGGARVWASPDVPTPAAWARRELTALASGAGADWPRLLPPAEEWFLWRQAASAAAGDLGVLDPGALADALQQASELAADYHLAPVRAPPDTEAGVLSAAQRHFESRCRELKAAGVTTLGGEARRGSPHAHAAAGRLRCRTPAPRGPGASRCGRGEHTGGAAHAAQH